MDESRLTLAVKDASGQTTRYAEDEPDAAYVFEDFAFSTGVAGGPKESSFLLRRDPELPWPDLNPLDSFLVTGPGEEEVTRGRLGDVPAERGDDLRINVNVNGPNIHLSDDPQFRQIFLDRMMESWGEPADSRIVQIQSAGNPYGTDHTLSVRRRCLHFEGPTQKNVEAGSTVEAWYRMPAGRKIASVALEYLDYSASVINTLKLRTTDAESGASVVDSGVGASGAGLNSWPVTTPTRYGFFDFKAAAGGYNRAAGNPPRRKVKTVGVYGDHGLPLYATTDPANDPPGVIGSDVIAYALAERAPLVPFTTGNEGTLKSSAQFVIPHLAFPDPVSVEELIQTVNSFYAWDWYIGDGGYFYFQPPDEPRRSWLLATSRGDGYSFVGATAEEAVNAVVVSYTDPNGESRTVGPPGSGCDVETTVLLDSSPSNPVNAHGIPRRTVRLEMPHTTTSLGAIEIGLRHLEALQTVESRGQATATGTVIDAETGAEVPAWAVRAGDAVRWTDIDGDPWHRVVGTNYRHNDRATSLELDARASTIESLMERLGVAVIGKGIS